MTTTPQAGDPVEVVPAVVDLGAANLAHAASQGGNTAGSLVTPVATEAVVTPTQIRRPWRSTARTVFQAVIALATLIPLVAADVYTDADATPAVVVQVLAVCGLVSRVMAMPAVEEFLRRFVPFLAAAPKLKG